MSERILNSTVFKIFTIDASLLLPALRTKILTTIENHEVLSSVNLSINFLEVAAVKIEMAQGEQYVLNSYLICIRIICQNAHFKNLEKPRYPHL